MDRERLDNWCERGILALVLAILVFGPLATGAVRPLEFLIVQGLTLGVIGLWVVRVWVKGSFRLLWPPVCWAVLLFVAYAVARYVQADIEYVARQELIRILIYAALFFAIVNNLHRQETTQILVGTLVFLGMAISFYAIYQFLTNSDRVWHFLKPVQYMKRGSGTYICPNHLAGLLEMIVPLGLAFVFTGRLGHATKVVWAYAVVVMLAGIGVSISRGGWAATALALLLFFIVLMRNRHYRILAVVVLALLLGGGYFFVKKAQATQQRFQQITKPGALEDSRFALWRPAVRIWQQHVWLGAGPGHFDYRFPAYRPINVQARPLRVHNDYLNLLADWGVAGFALVALAWALLFSGARKIWKFAQAAANDLTVKQSNRTALVLGAGTGLLALLLHSFVDFNLHVPANAIVVVTLMALVTGHMRFATDRYWVTAGWLLRLLVSAVCLAGLGYLGQQELRRAQEYRWQQRAAAARGNFNAELAALKKAHEIEPKNFETTYKIGEALRGQSWLANDDFKERAEEAMKWFKLGIELNRYDAYNYMRTGMCLDWMGRTEEADPYFQRAGELDPNGFYLVAHLGWHQINRGNWERAKTYFERSLELTAVPYSPNPLAASYLEIVKQRLAEAAPAK